MDGGVVLLVVLSVAMFTIVIDMVFCCFGCLFCCWDLFSVCLFVGFV